MTSLPKLLRIRPILLAILCAAAPLSAGAEDSQADTAAFLTETETILDRLQTAYIEAAWLAQTDITPQHDSAETQARQAYEAELRSRAARARDLRSDDPVAQRKLLRLKLSSDGIIADPALNRRFSEVGTAMRNHYAQACPIVDSGQPCLTREKIEAELLRVRDPVRLERLWTAWYDMARPLAARYPEYVELSNRGARDSGYSDASVMSKAAYEVDPVAFSAELDALWEELRPLYRLLHAYVRAKLVAYYGPDKVDPTGPIPIHLLGNLWGQDWEGIYDILAVPGAPIDFNKIFDGKNMKPEDFVSSAEKFFYSLGFPALPASFRERSYFQRPRDNFECHPSAWDVGPSDWRLKMCIEINWANFITVHHEVGHIFYFQSFAAQPFLFRDAPNAGINEAIGDAAALSVTPDYLQKIGLLKEASGDDLGQLFRVALRKLARVPFGLMLQKWRWAVMSGQIPPERYNEAWWALVREYQGLAPPSPRPADGFDPGAKEHIAADIDYTRYFLADVLTFQIHDALAREAGCTEPVHRCSVYESRRAGERWRTAMALGASRPWTETLEVMTGDQRILGQPMRDYLAPLEKWLAKQTQGKPIGWK